MKNLQLKSILLPTENASILSLMGDYLKLSEKNIKRIRSINQHLYLVSDSPIKEGDWWYCPIIKKPSKAFSKENTLQGLPHRTAQKIEFTTDPKLIADGVLAIDGNTKAFIEKYSPARGNVFENEVLFLEEYCKRYNQKDNQKGVDVEEYVKEQMDGVTKSRTYLPSEIEHLIRETYKDGIKANVGGFSLEDMRNIMNIGMSLRQDQLNGYSGKSGEELLQEYTKEQPKGDEEALKRLQEVWGDDKDGKYAELYNHHKSKGDIIIECEMEEYETLIFNKDLIVVEGRIFKIKLSKDGQPILIFK